MSALDALALARAHEVAVELKGDQLRLLSRGPPPGEVLAALKGAKPQVIILLTPDASGTSGVNYWRVFNDGFAERIAAGIEPELARLEAFDAAFNEWLKQSFDLIDATIDQNSCAHCGKADGDALLPIGPNAYGCHAWIHDQCHELWRKARQIKALAALSAYGLDPPQAWLLARAESEAYEREIVDWWRTKPESYPDGFDAAWAIRMLEEIKTLGFRAYFHDEGTLLLTDATGERRPPPAHAIKGLGRIKRGLRVDPGLIEAIWPSGGERRRLSPEGGIER
jgi:hypothetical protein